MPSIGEENPAANREDISWNDEAQVELPADVPIELVNMK
jgi:hypothetical protein